MPLQFEAEARQVMNEFRLDGAATVGNQYDPGARKAFVDEAFGKQVPPINSMDDQRDQAGWGKEHACAARKVNAHLQGKDRTGEQEKHGRPKQTTGAELTAKSQQCRGLLHPATLHQRNEEG